MTQPIPSIMPGAEPFFFRGADTGVLLMHGISASPHEVRWLGEYLREQGLTVYGVRAAGHGADFRDLSRMYWEDWYLSGLDGYHLLRTHCERVVVAGMSMGGLLALLMASELETAGVVAMAAPLRLPTERQMRRARWYKRLRRFLYMPDRSSFPQRILEHQAEDGKPVIGRVRYDMWATQAIEELYEVMTVVREHLDRVTVPVLLIYSQSDPTVPFGNMDYLQARLGSRHIETMTLQQSGHILTQDQERKAVFERVAQFVGDI